MVKNSSFFKIISMDYQLRPIAYIRNGFTDKFGIPRQSREESVITSRIVFTPEFSNPDAIRGIEQFSHLWLIWGFDERSNNLTVRPPRLGGNTRMGVFATRSPFRPNPLGLTSVRLLGLGSVSAASRELIVSGADLLDGTPIFDIKPYIPYTDCHPEATNGFAEAGKDYRLTIDESSKPSSETCPEEIWAAIKEILSQDPRPGYQDNPTRIYKLDYAGYNIAFFVKNGIVYIKNIFFSEKK